MNINRLDSNNQIISTEYEVYNTSADVYDAKLIFPKISDQIFGIYTFQVQNNGGRAIQKINLIQNGIENSIRVLNIPLHFFRDVSNNWRTQFSFEKDSYLPA